MSIWLWAVVLVAAYVLWRLVKPGRGVQTQHTTQSEVLALPPYAGAYRDLDIVGESFRQDEIEQLWSTGSDGTFTAVLIPEDDNPHDENAVRVEVEGLHVGYLSRECAKDYRSHMGDQQCAVPVHLVQGGEDKMIGVFTGISRHS